MNSTITELKLQRWVDGQVSRDEERELLADCDRHPGQWRRVALAFIEERAMGREFADQFGDQFADQLGGALAPPSHSPNKPSTAKPSPAVRGASWIASNRVQMWCAVAASLLLGLLVGNAFDWRAGGDDPAAPGPSIAQTSPRTSVQRPVFPGSAPSMVEYIPDASRGDRYQLPILDEEKLPPEYFDREVEITGLPPELEQFLRQHGIEIQGRRNFQSYEVSEGEVLVFPTLHFEIRQERPAP